MVAQAARFVDNAILEEIKIEILNNTVFIRSSNPYGFYRISLQKGHLPESLKGMYTSTKTAQEDAMRWIEEKAKALPVTA